MAARKPTIFDVRILSKSPWGKPTNTTVGRAATLHAAFTRVVEILQQWSAAEGAIKEGTRVSIVDLRDGGTIFAMEYLGFEPQLPEEGTPQWQGNAKGKRNSTTNSP